MRVEEWDRVKTLFEAALGVPADERASLLMKLGSGDETIVAAVLSLLRNHSETVSAPQPRALALVFQPGDLAAARFRIIRHVNSGGMGDVYEAFDERLSLRVALKTMRPELLANPEAVARFQREIRVARGVAHQNLCRLFEFVEHRSPEGCIIPCLTMEFVDGETLSAMLERERPLPPSAALGVIRQIAAALDTLHQHGILHRDLKPSNVMVRQEPDGSWRAVVMDFGLAKTANGPDDLFESSIHFQGGAPYFMSPEQLRGERPTAASDIYAFGLVVDEMVTRSPAYSASSVQSLYYAKLWEQPESPKNRAERLPENWTAAILQCLSRTPAARPASAGAVVQLLERRRSWPLARLAAARARLRSFRPATYVAAVSSLTLILLLATLEAPAVPLQIADFANQTSDASYNYLCGGLTGEVTRRFGAIDGVDPVPLHRTRLPEGNPRGRFRVNGDLRSDEGQLALQVALYDTRRPREALWSRRFTPSEIADPLQVEAEIVGQTVSAMERTLSWSTVSLRLRRAPGLRSVSNILRPAGASGERKPSSPKNSRALDDFMRGKQMAEQMSPEKVHTGIELLQRSVAEDPSFALGYTALANASFSLLNWNRGSAGTLLTDAKAFAQTAITLDSNLAEAYEARALVYQHEWDWARARDDYNRALRLKPSFALARRHYAVLLTQTGDLEEGLRQARQAREDDPYDDSALPGYGLILYIAGRAREAVSVLDRPASEGMVAASHNLGEAYAVLALQSSGSLRAEYFRKALEQAERLRQLESRGGRGVGDLRPVSDRLFAQFYALKGDRASSDTYLTRVRKELDMGLLSLPEVAWVYAAAGRKDEALSLLEQALPSHDRHLLFTKVYPFVDPLREDPRFRRILSQMHL